MRFSRCIIKSIGVKKSQKSFLVQDELKNGSVVDVLKVNKPMVTGMLLT